ncbi:MAG: MerR family transcriptional regulator [Serpentinimonas sp.]|nr:MAG: MerR family transcriptional regulator [Comamonadaceae bacterium BICA1-1]MDO9610809.1 MerR family transcriptional regulator [Serpentinimonas sp.]
MSHSYQLSELCALVDLPTRTVRYYVQHGLVDRPEGGTRAARYGARQLEQLHLIKKWSAAGLSLNRIRELLAGDDPGVPERAKRRGRLEVVSRLTIDDGVELVIEPGWAGLTPEQVRAFSRGVMRLYDELRSPAPPTAPRATPDQA